MAKHDPSAGAGAPGTVSGKATMFVCSDACSTSPPLLSHIAAAKSPLVPCIHAAEHCAWVPLSQSSKPERRSFPDYLSISDRYSARIKFD
jgi:hypothetical protein